MTSVDVVVPCYNYAHYLEGCIATVLSQRDVEVRILIINDCSPDNTEEVAQRLAESDPRITYLRNERNLGLIGTANRGVMDWATGDYVVLLSADDLLAPGALARAAGLMDANPEISLTYGMALMLHDNQPAPVVQDTRSADTRIVPGPDFLKHLCEQGNAVPTPTAVMRTSVQHRIGGYNDRFKHTSDVDTWLRAAAAGSIGIINAVQGLYRWHDTNMSAAYQRRPIGDRREMLATCEEFFRLQGDRYPEFADWLDAMKQRFAQEALWIASCSFNDPHDASWRDSLSFASELNSALWTSPVWWKLMAKRAVGTKVAARLSRSTIEPALNDNGRIWFEHGEQIGWWPGNA
ncbi:glycosyltransferase [Hyphomonas sp. WL0036]|uniref:glycosyltransferase family 2 protein n=1 Tax=Hyphomonas sediminis TaxID=2866160 RepID=UPI001C7FB7DE|nr:glycosyltransferase [Hyphomonas sediminis]MBY9067941.1 glycosyltransferase [Hyphomonas sediminis]